jgi:GNAT superfamily N-acetyltransferase
MAAINYDNRRFRSVANSATGEVDAETVFSYHQQDDVVWATYEGGAIRFGTLSGRVDDEGGLDFAYQHVNRAGQIMTGVCRSTPERLVDGRLRLHEVWRWTSGDLSEGESIVEEMSDEEASSSDPDIYESVYQTPRGEYTISTDPARLDPRAIYAYLSRSYWAKGRPRFVVERSLRYSLCFGVYWRGQQVGLARVITDYATYMYLCDVYVLEEHRGHGLGKWLIASVTSCPALRLVRSWMLATRDAHGLYSQFGWEALPNPERWMLLTRPLAI